MAIVLSMEALVRRGRLSWRVTFVLTLLFSESFARISYRKFKKDVNARFQRLSTSSGSGTSCGALPLSIWSAVSVLLQKAIFPMTHLEISKRKINPITTM